jgi:hypothetical protein
MKHSSRIVLLAAIVFLDRATAAFAGMPVLLLSDLARMRVQTISFFLVCRRRR